MLKPIGFVKRRFTNRPDAEHIQVLIRLAIVSTAMVYFHSAYFANNAANAEYALLARWAVSIAFVITIALFAAILMRPGVSVTRRIVGLVHDVAAISTAMFLGEAGAAAVAAIYLWVTLGNGFRYGIAYLYGCAVLSIAGFGSVFLFSEYWREQQMLSINILILLILIPPYVAGLLKSLREAQAQLRQRASFDSLTGLMNRSEFEQHISTVLSLTKDGHFLLFCDLDHFKAVNDKAGHAAGDKLLADIGQIIQENVRSDDLTARLGGDEFAVFLKSCPHERVRAIAESIRNAISGYRLAWSTDYYSVGVSVGAAPSAAVKDLASLFRLADAACYAAKNAGRNQIHLIDERDVIEDTNAIRTKLAKSPSSGDNSVGRTVTSMQRRKA
ncbi:MAG: GGDEF domain-containing protein [Pseudomonadota bacterium]